MAGDIHAWDRAFNFRGNALRKISLKNLFDWPPFLQIAKLPQPLKECSGRVNCTDTCALAKNKTLSRVFAMKFNR